jgi:hypothetical protein
MFPSATQAFLVRDRPKQGSRSPVSLLFPQARGPAKQASFADIVSRPPAHCPPPPEEHWYSLGLALWPDALSEGVSGASRYEARRLGSRFPRFVVSMPAHTDTHTHTHTHIDTHTHRALSANPFFALSSRKCPVTRHHGLWLPARGGAFPLPLPLLLPSPPPMKPERRKETARGSTQIGGTAFLPFSVTTWETYSGKRHRLGPVPVCKQPLTWGSEGGEIDLSLPCPAAAVRRLTVLPPPPSKRSSEKTHRCTRLWAFAWRLPTSLFLFSVLIFLGFLKA